MMDVKELIGMGGHAAVKYGLRLLINTDRAQDYEVFKWMGMSDAPNLARQIINSPDKFPEGFKMMVDDGACASILMSFEDLGNVGNTPDMDVVDYPIRAVLYQPKTMQGALDELLINGAKEQQPLVKVGQGIYEQRLTEREMTTRNNDAEVVDLMEVWRWARLRAAVITFGVVIPVLIILIALTGGSVPSDADLPAAENTNHGGQSIHPGMEGYSKPLPPVAGAGIDRVRVTERSGQ